MKRTLLSLRLAIGSLSLLMFSMVPLSADDSVNSLTQWEELSGWELLFDGNSTEGWRNYKQDKISAGWQVEDGAIVRSGANAGDIITEEKFKYFELSIEYKISKGGNSGIMFHVAENDGPPYSTGPEIQVQDNVDGSDPQKSGWLYQLYQPPRIDGQVLDATRPAGEWNQIFMRITPSTSEVNMNGVRYYTFNVGDQRWKDLIAKSKFAKMEGFGAMGEGHICLQDHGNLVSYRNIKVRRINDDGSVPQPITGKIPVKGVLAFPELKYNGWEGIDDGGNIRKLRIMELTFAKGNKQKLYAATQRGVVHAFDNDIKPQTSSILLDIQDKVSQWDASGGNNEQGLLGLALHPKHSENGLLYVYYTKRADDTGVIACFHVAADSQTADPASEKILLEIPQPFKNHNGGSLEFGPDGYLYLGLGDGGLRNDPLNAGQDLTKLLGSILRIDVDKPGNGKPYSIPADNPFVGVDGAQPEIFAFGIRNPWRIAFDPKTGHLWTGDVGQELWEEINIVEKGGNYGWSSREGTNTFGNAPVRDNVTAPIDPVWAYDHGVGKSITGGRVYRGERLPQLSGKYIYADYVSGSVWALTYDADAGKVTHNESLIESGVPVLAFGQDANGEVYYCIDSAQGQCIYRFEAE